MQRGHAKAWPPGCKFTLPSYPAPPATPKPWPRPRPLAFLKLGVFPCRAGGEADPLHRVTVGRPRNHGLDTAAGFRVACGRSVAVSRREAPLPLNPDSARRQLCVPEQDP